MAEHLLDAAQVGAALEQMRRERVPQEVRVDAPGLEAGRLGEPAQDQERARAGQRAALRVQEELGPVATVEVGPAARRGSGAAPRPPGARPGRPAPCRPCRARGRRRSSRSTPFFSRPDRLGDAQAGAVEELDERPVAQRPRRRPARGLDQPLGLAGRERPRQACGRGAAARSRRPGCRCAPRSAAGGGRSVRAAAVRRASVAGESPSARSSAV